MRYAIIYKGKEVVEEIELQEGAGLFYNDREYTCKVFDTETEAMQLKDFLKVEKPIKANYEQILEMGKQEFSERQSAEGLRQLAENYLSLTEYPQIEKKKDPEDIIIKDPEEGKDIGKGVIGKK